MDRGFLDAINMQVKFDLFLGFVDYLLQQLSNYLGYRCIKLIVPNLRVFYSYIQFISMI